MAGLPDPPDLADLTALVDLVVAASFVTHNTGLALAGACHGVDAFPPGAIATIDAQGLSLATLADDLYALRS